MSEIIQRDALSLRKISKEVAADEIGGEKITEILRDLKETLSEEEDGVAIAAPQIGKNLRIFLVSGKILRKKGGQKPADMVFINPVIIKKSRASELVDEGCLSVRWYYGFVKRAKKVSVKALNEKGHEFVKDASGLLAQIFQHEIDHLDGILFIDKAKNLVELPPGTDTNRND